MSEHPSEATPVIIVGGGLAGLCTALFLRSHGVPSITLERHPKSSLHPRAIGYTPRTMEIFRSIGLGPPKIEEAPAFFTVRRARVKSLTGEWYEELPWTDPKDKQNKEKIQYSPVRGAAVAQDTLEPILRDQAREFGADIRMSHKMLRFTQDDSSVTVTAQDPDGKEYTIRGQYLVACDGHRSSIREALGIKTSGRGLIKTLRSVLFRAPKHNEVLDKPLEGGVSQFNIDQPDLQAFMTTYRDGRWVLMFEDDSNPSEEELLQQIQKAIGRSDLDYEIITTGRWEVTGSIAERFSEGRVFLAGDAAHTLPPSRGGYGANTGIQDAHNLAWKLAAVVSGISSPTLLESYDAERRPVAWLRHQQLFIRADYEKMAMKADEPEVLEKPKVIDDDAIEFGQLYRSNAVLGAGEELLPARRPDEWLGQPGSRASHLWVLRENDEEKISILDIFQKEWVLLFEDEQWNAAAEQAGKELGIELEAVQFGKQIKLAEGKSTEEFLKWYGLGSRGASLVRPDGYIAWRVVDVSQEETAPELARQLTHALGAVSSAKRVYDFRVIELI